MAPPLVTLLIDNYDSFTHNLFSLLTIVNGVEPRVIRNDDPQWSDRLSELLAEVDNVVLSPGPGSPDVDRDVGISRRLLELAGDVPVLGVCLGHQLLAHHHGGDVRNAPEPRHGRTSRIHHDGHPLFADIPSPFLAMRYHSLAVADSSDDMRVIATADDGVTMAIAHDTLPHYGVQFHPESVSTEFGVQLLQNFAELTRSRRSRVVRRVRRIDSWYEPSEVFAAHFAHNPVSVWLDSATQSWLSGRFSYQAAADGPLAFVLRAEGDAVTRADGDCTQRFEGSIFPLINAELRRHHLDSDDLPFDFQLGFVGYLGYEMKSQCDAAPTALAPSDIPDAQLAFVDRCIVFDHHERCIWIMWLEDEHGRNAEWCDALETALAHGGSVDVRTPSALGTASPVVTRFDRAEYVARVTEAQAALRRGESYEICLTNEFRTAPLADSLATYLRLRTTNPASFGAFLRFDDVQVLSSSPERFLRVDRNGIVEACPVKGTVARSGVDDADEIDALCVDEKQRAEHLMIVDLLRNDLTRSCTPTSVHAPTLLHVETLTSVHQLVSVVRGELRAGSTAADAVRHAFPGGSMTGAPKYRTMQIIEALEGAPRGIYSGAIGFFSLNGAADWSIVIRTIVNTPTSARVGSGGAITVLSDPNDEYDEMMLKARLPLEALGVDSSTLGDRVHD